VKKRRKKKKRKKKKIFTREKLGVNPGENKEETRRNWGSCNGEWTLKFGHSSFPAAGLSPPSSLVMWCTPSRRE